MITFMCLCVKLSLVQYRYIVLFTYLPCLMIHCKSLTTPDVHYCFAEKISSSSAVVLLILKTAYHERILPLRIEGNMICKLGQLAATQ